MSELTIEQLPKAVGEIKAKLDNIEQLLMENLGKGGATWVKSRILLIYKR